MRFSMAWQITRNDMLRDHFPDIQKGDMTSVERPWHSVFLILPRRSINDRWIWGQAYRRRVWIYTGFIDEPQSQYGTMFDVMRWS